MLLHGRAVSSVSATQQTLPNCQQCLHKLSFCRQVSCPISPVHVVYGLFAAFDQALEFHKSRTIPANWKTELKEDRYSSEAEEEEEEEDDEKEKEDNSSEEEVSKRS